MRIASRGSSPATVGIARRALNRRDLAISPIDSRLGLRLSSGTAPAQATALSLSPISPGVPASPSHTSLLSAGKAFVHTRETLGGEGLPGSNTTYERTGSLVTSEAADDGCFPNDFAHASLTLLTERQPHRAIRSCRDHLPSPVPAPKRRYRTLIVR
jgi:hypothetical protein